jgi:hypothetical protein
MLDGLMGLREHITGSRAHGAADGSTTPDATTGERPLVALALATLVGEAWLTITSSRSFMRSNMPFVPSFSMPVAPPMLTSLPLNYPHIPKAGWEDPSDVAVKQWRDLASRLANDADAVFEEP